MNLSLREKESVATVRRMGMTPERWTFECFETGNTTTRIVAVESYEKNMTKGCTIRINIGTANSKVTTCKVMRREYIGEYAGVGMELNDMDATVLLSLTTDVFKWITLAMKYGGDARDHVFYLLGQRKNFHRLNPLVPVSMTKITLKGIDYENRVDDETA